MKSVSEEWIEHHKNWIKYGNILSEQGNSVQNEDLKSRQQCDQNQI